MKTQVKITPEDLIDAGDAYIGYPLEAGEDITTTIRRNAFSDGFIAGAQWQKEQDEAVADSVKFEEGFKTGREVGAREQKEQMLKWVREKQEGLGMLHCRDQFRVGMSAAYEEIITKLTED